MATEKEILNLSEITKKISEYTEIIANDEDERHSLYIRVIGDLMCRSLPRTDDDEIVISEDKLIIISAEVCNFVIECLKKGAERQLQKN